MERLQSWQVRPESGFPSRARAKQCRSGELAIWASRGTWRAWRGSVRAPVPDQAQVSALCGRVGWFATRVTRAGGQASLGHAMTLSGPVFNGGKSLFDGRKPLGDLCAKPPGDGLKLFEVGTMLTHGCADCSRETFQALVLRGKLQYLIPRCSRLGRDFSTAFVRA